MTNTWQATQLPYRQAQVLEDMANGKTYDECAEHRGISRTVVNNTIQTLFYKFGLSRGNKTKLVAEAIHQGILTSTAAMLLICVLINMMAGLEDWQVRRTSPRLSTRISRTVRNRGREQTLFDDHIDLINPPANDDHIPDAGNMVIAEHPRCGKPYYLAECRTISGRLVMAEGRTPGECKAALFNALNYHTATMVA